VVAPAIHDASKVKVHARRHDMHACMPVLYGTYSSGVICA
jgi:hypothetical protein